MFLNWGFEDGKILKFMVLHLGADGIVTQLQRAQGLVLPKRGGERLGFGDQG